MFLGVGYLNDTEIWNNQRVLDYLVGDPANGIPGMASPFTSVNRKSSCSAALPLICDQPVDLVPVSATVAISRVSADTMQVSFVALSLDGVSQSFIRSGGSYVIEYTPGDIGQPIPSVPDLSDPAWDVASGPIPSFPLPAVFEVGPSTAPTMIRGSFGPVGLAGSLEAAFYLDPLSPDNFSAVSFNDGTGWSPWATVATGTKLIDSETGTRYSTPTQDDAPWYDPAVPESADFAGLFVEEVTGFDAMTKRQLEDSALIGGTLGPLNLTARSITVTGWLRSATCCAADYGLSWLTEALMGNNSCDGCALGELIMFKCCPPDSDVDPDPAVYSRHLLRTGLADGPKVVDRSGTCCGNCTSTSLKVQFTIISETPYIFSDAEWVLFEDEFIEGPFDYDLTLPCDRARCPDAPPEWEPNCGPTYFPPPPPNIVQDDCYCEPWETMRVAATFVNEHQWNDVSSVIQVHAGDTDLRNLKIVAFKNKRNLACPLQYETSEEWICVDPCASVAVSEMPSGSTLVIDSRTRTINLMLAGGGQISGLRFVSSGREQIPFSWFDVGPCTQLCLVASVEASGAAGATISVGFLNRYLASGG